MFEVDINLWSVVFVYYHIIGAKLLNLILYFDFNSM